MSQPSKKAEKIKLLSFKGPHMRTFHITWITFFFCFFAWFGLAPMMKVVKDDLHLTKSQIGNIIIASIAATIFARLLMGWLCDKIGARKTYTILLLVGAIPVIMVGLATTYESFLIYRLAIGIIGASFVITQYHTSAMFAPNVVGTANAISGGWGNLGGGVTNMVMPLIFGAIMWMGYTSAQSWRLAMIIPGVILLILSFVYYKFTQDTPEGNFEDLKKHEKTEVERGSFKDAILDVRTWALFLAYGACFGMEITFDNVAALYFSENLGESLTQFIGSTDKTDVLKWAGMLAGVFGLMNLFARAVGGIIADAVGGRYGLKGKGLLLSGLLIFEGFGIVAFSTTQDIWAAIIIMLGFAMFLKMANGTTYSIVPFVNKKSVGSVSGIVGAGGNVGGLLMGFAFKSESLTYTEAFSYIGFAVVIVGVIMAVVPFNKGHKHVASNSQAVKKEKHSIAA
jgi:MFS transporter, NNP family, nitrate/nitrite transporter